jgi:hypothetical protein
MQSEWNDGILECCPPARSACGSERILGVRAEITHFNCKKTPSKPSFLPNETFLYFTGAITPIGAKPLSSFRTDRSDQRQLERKQETSGMGASRIRL